ncbi:bifunctional glutamate N-acetyltransferase/amino-acid acetyltransferase ArgJ [Mariniblastus sp.]|nr:bifunctional glutamate N-acetyltransferase/amino-acid acetyltransferase ArgJ [Mariniblastus sp.]MDA7913365.1 bifunctional glutamate N-acetyltransferase/amino-acid acetyltransferase ArgJ [bacterium]MDA7928819.1 bifunctional glutamate N-acetyltransferase/amino-acid acetyltransferase ArgJ [Mariniblastus sp.]MDB4381081.1 bifunctional glutamate N-acetyltransferase/amino-acid acetyltransferase ArgJ [Mariniblastus sp.]MDB4458783.1 bifunctional glutamate N-acetyltransferase/amino-acid acetyltransfer
MGLPGGFEFTGIACGIKPSGKLDLAVVSAKTPCVAVGVYTQNVVRAASIEWNQQRTPTEGFKALIINSGNANACTGQRGIDDNQAIAAIAAKHLNAKETQVLVLSTGVIGQHLPMQTTAKGIEKAISEQGNSQDHFDRATMAILTTDKGPKTVESVVSTESGEIKIAGMAKGAGMIGPKMATMLAIILSDAKISSEKAQQILNRAVEKSFNRISVEGHTSTNDALVMICNGNSAVEVDSEESVQAFERAITENCIQLAKQIPADGEGASHLITIDIAGATNDDQADSVARTVAASALVKTAITGSDPNWGRIVSAAGYAGAEMDVSMTSLKLNGFLVFENGQPVDFDAKQVSEALKEQFETLIELSIGGGTGSARHWTSDLTQDYVRFNSEYTT